MQLSLAYWLVQVFFVLLARQVPGLVHLGKNDPAEAQLYLTIASEKDSVNGDIWFHLGQAYKHLKQFEQARASLENAVGID